MARQRIAVRSESPRLHAATYGETVTVYVHDMRPRFGRMIMCQTNADVEDGRTIENRDMIELRRARLAAIAVEEPVCDLLVRVALASHDPRPEPVEGRAARAP